MVVDGSKQKNLATIDNKVKKFKQILQSLRNGHIWILNKKIHFHTLKLKLDNCKFWLKTKKLIFN